MTPLETFEAKAGLVLHLATAGVAVISIAIVLVGGDRAAAWSGMSYGLIGVVHGGLGAAYGPKRARLQAEANMPV